MPVKKIVVVSMLLLSLAVYVSATCYVEFITEGLPMFFVGVPANVQIEVCCATAPYTFSLYSGTMPAGLSLSSAGVISGTPTTVTDDVIFVRATDALGCHTTSAFSIYVE